MLGRLRDILRFSNPEPVEFWTGLNLIVTGLWYLLPFNTFASSTSYAWANKHPILSEHYIGLCMFAIGTLVISSLAAHSQRSRSVALVLASIMLAFIGLLFTLSSPYSAGAAIYSVPVAAAAWSYWRLRA